MPDQENQAPASATSPPNGPSPAPPPPGYTYGWVPTPAGATPSQAQPTGGAPGWAKSIKTTWIIVAVLGVFIVTNLLPDTHKAPAKTGTAASPTGPRLTPRDQVDAIHKANEEAARLERNNQELRERHDQALGTGGATGTTGKTVAGSNTGSASGSGNAGGQAQPSETQKILEEIRAERLKQQYASLWTSPIAATWEPPQTTLTSSNPALTGTANISGAKEIPPAAPASETDPNQKQFPYDHSTGPYHVIQKGTLLGATLLMDLDGERGGPVVAQIDKDNQVYVKQTDTLLIPEGTTLVGTAQSVSSGNQHLLGVSFDSLIMQDGYALALTKPVTGLSQDGKGGLEGKVDTHWPSKLAWSFAIGAIEGISSGAFGFGNGSTGPAVILRTPGADMSQLFQGILNRPNNVKIPAGTRIRIILTEDLNGVPEADHHQMQPGVL